MGTSRMVDPERALGFLRSLDRVAITAHVGADGDALGSAAALFYLMEDLGASPRLCYSDEVPAYLRWLLPQQPSHTIPKGHELLVVDTSRPERVGVSYSEAAFNLDHHEDNPLYGRVNLVDPFAAASAEIVGRLYEAAGIPLKGRAAEAVYTGIFTDTGGFRFRNISPEVHELAARLLRGGVVPAEIDDRLNRSATIEQVNLVGISMASARRYGRVLISTVDAADYARANAAEADSKQAIDQLRTVGGVEVVAHLRETPEGTKGSLRSETVDVASVARRIGGGGHRLAAGFTMTGVKPQEAKERLLKLLSEVVEVEEGQD